VDQYKFIYGPADRRNRILIDGTVSIQPRHVRREIPARSAAHTFLAHAFLRDRGIGRVPE
jgi:hypothetical protein